MSVLPACPRTLNPNYTILSYLGNRMDRGTSFVWCGRNWRLLDILTDRDNGEICLLAITADPIWADRIRFGDDNKWSTSDIRMRLQEEFLPLVRSERLHMIVTDMIADSGSDNYGCCNDQVSILTADAYRAYKKWLPQYNDNIWLATPWESAFPGCASGVRFASSSGALSYNYAYRAFGLVPGLCAISSSALADGEIEIINA